MIICEEIKTFIIIILLSVIVCDHVKTRGHFPIIVTKIFSSINYASVNSTMPNYLGYSTFSVPAGCKCTRDSKSHVRKLNSIELNQTQSVNWVRLSSAIKRNRTPDFQWVRFPNKSNSIKQIELNQTQSVNWVRLSSAIKRNRTPDFQWVRFPNKSNSIEQIELNRTQSIWLCSIEFGNQTQSHKLIDWVRLALVNLYKASPKQAPQSRFFLCFVTIYSIPETPFINCLRHLREQNRTEQNKAIIIPAGVFPNCRTLFLF